MVLGSDSWKLGNADLAGRCRALANEGVEFFPVANHLGQRLEQAGVSPDKITCAPNGVDAEMFYWEEDGRKLADESTPGIEPDDRVVLFVGNLVAVKGPDVLMEAWRQLKRTLADEAHDIKLVIIGDGVMRARLEGAAGNDIVFAGRISPDGVAAWMRRSSALCLTSRDEGMPNVVLEAMACGLPVVASAVGGVPDILRGMPSAFAVPSGDVEALAGSLAECLSQPVDRAAISAKAHARWSWDKQARTILGRVGLSDRVGHE